jgi:hypothetical protein
MISYVSHTMPEMLWSNLNRWLFKLKGGIGEPTSYLGATISKHKVPGTGQELWYMSSTEYLKEAIRNIEAKGAKLTSKDVTTPSDSCLFSPRVG